MIPASSSAFTKNLEDPSIIGGSEALSSIRRLSISSPTQAASTCSVVCIETPFLSRFVPRCVFVTSEASALSIGSPSISRRLNL